jgi:hypothetical protein
MLEQIDIAIKMAKSKKKESEMLGLLRDFIEFLLLNHELEIQDIQVNDKLTKIEFLAKRSLREKEYRWYSFIDGMALTVKSDVEKILNFTKAENITSIDLRHIIKLLVSYKNTKTLAYLLPELTAEQLDIFIDKLVWAKDNEASKPVGDMVSKTIIMIDTLNLRL